MHSPAVVPPPPHPAGPPVRRPRVARRFARALDRWSWPVAMLVTLIYAAAFANFIAHHSSFPYYDSYDYLVKTWTIADRVSHANVFGLLNPNLYIEPWPADRPPLLPTLAAYALGPGSEPRSVAIVWATARIAAILLAVYLLAREFRSARWVPAALLVIFASPVMGNFTRLYMMDEPFAAFGLLAFALLIIDDRRGTWRSSAAASIGIVLLCLVKPVAPSFLFPVIVLRAARALYPLVTDRANLKPHLRRLIPWAIPYVLLLLALLGLYFLTPLGPAIKKQYALGQSGFWRVDLTPSQAFRLASYLLPPWLLVTTLVCLPFARRWPNKPVLLYTTAAVLWWSLFSFFLTYTIEDRLIGQAMPLVVTGLALFLCQRPLPTVVVTLLAAFFFTHNALAAANRAFIRPGRPLAGAVDTVSPAPGHLVPVPEVGLTPLAKNLLATIPPPPNNQPTPVLGVFGDIYVEPNAINLALRSLTPSKHPRINVNWTGSQPATFSVAQFCRYRWVLTKQARRSNGGYANTGLWTSIETYNLLLSDPDSPLLPYYRKRSEHPITLPWATDTLVLWELPAPPPKEALVAALHWLEPKLTNDPRKPVIEQEIQSLSATPATTTPTK